jgi:hypothetical protein
MFGRIVRAFWSIRGFSTVVAIILFALSMASNYLMPALPSPLGAETMKDILDRALILAIVGIMLLLFFGLPEKLYPWVYASYVTAFGLVLTVANISCRADLDVVGYVFVLVGAILVWLSVSFFLHKLILSEETTLH